MPYVFPRMCIVAFFVSLSGCVGNAPRAGDNTIETGSVVGVSAARSVTDTSASARSVGQPEKSKPGVTAYQLQDCKPTDDWSIIDGSCASLGKFSGKGVGVRNGIMFIGNFENGVPQGRGSMCFHSLTKDYERTYGKKPDCSRFHLVCSVEYKDGKIHGTEMSCRMKSGEKNISGKERSGLEIVLHSPAGFFIDDGAFQARKDGFHGGKASIITTDQAQVEINGQVVYSPLRTGSTTTSSSANGVIRQVAMDIDKFSFDRFVGVLKIANPNGKSSSGDLRVKGTFKGQLNSSTVIFSPYPFATLNGKDVTKESLVELSYGERSYELVHELESGTRNTVSSNRVIYYKDNSGVEFDGTYRGCVDKLKRFGSANLREIRNLRDGTFQGYEIIPMCGRITTPSGSYSGMFRNGRPE